MQFINNINILLITVLLTTFSTAFPLLNKREIVTRIHTASTTNTVTDFYSTTTKVIIAPTVYYIVDGDTTSTSTAIPSNVDPAATPATTIVLNRKDLGKGGDGFLTSTLSPSSSYTETSMSQDNTQFTISTDESLSTQATSFRITSTLSPSITSEEVSSSLESKDFKASEVTFHLHETVESSGIQVIVSTTTQQGNGAATSATYGTSDNDQQYTSLSSSSFITTTTAAAATEAAAAVTSTNTAETVSSSSSSMLTSIPYALAYSPYNDDGSCRSASDVYSDLHIIKNKGVNRVRIYGTDCNSLETVEPACAELGITINQGLWISAAGVDSIDEPLQLLIAYGQSNGWDIFDYITVGNEAINSGYCSVSDLVNKIKSVKGQLRAAGYTGQITTSEPPVTFENYPELCTESEIDFVGINPHSYFDASCDAAGSGEFVKGQVEIVQKSCGTSNVVITETGYPSQGDVNGENVPSKANQLIAVQSILDLNSDVTILTFTNDYWKDPGPYGIEQYFGIRDILP